MFLDIEDLNYLFGLLVSIMRVVGVVALNRTLRGKQINRTALRLLCTPANREINTVQ